jgi:hypothetical protein
MGKRRSKGSVSGRGGDRFEEFCFAFGEGMVRKENCLPGHYDTFFAPTIGSMREYFNVEVPYRSAQTSEAYLKLGYIRNNQQRNAVSDRVENSLCCGIFSSVPYHFLELATCCLLHREFLPFLGHPESSSDQLEKLEKTVIFGFYAEHFADLDKHEQFLESLHIRCPIRAAAAEWLMHLMLEFYWYHEIGHALYGHADYLQGKRRSTAVAEGDAIDLRGRMLLERIVLEKQADAFADTELFSVATIDGSMRAGEAFGLTREQVVAVRMVSVILVCYSWIWHEFRKDTATFKKVRGRSHPPGIVRYTYLLRAMRAKGTDVFRVGSPENKTLITDIAKTSGIPPRFLVPSRPQLDVDVCTRAVEILDQQIEQLVNMHASFEGIEHFRISLGNEVEQFQSEVGHDQLLGRILERYTYGQ